MYGFINICIYTCTDAPTMLRSAFRFWRLDPELQMLQGMPWWFPLQHVSTWLSCLHTVVGNCPMAWGFWTSPSNICWGLYPQ